MFDTVLSHIDVAAVCIATAASQGPSQGWSKSHEHYALCDRIMRGRLHPK